MVAGTGELKLLQAQERGTRVAGVLFLQVDCPNRSISSQQSPWSLPVVLLELQAPHMVLPSPQ